MSSCVPETAPRCPLKLWDDTSFKRAVTRERKRSQRSGLAMVMLLVDVQQDQGQRAPGTSAKIAQALSAVMSDIDVLGWFEQEAVLGLIVPDISPELLEQACERIKGEFQKAVSGLSGRDVSRRLSMKLHTFPHPQGKREDDLNNLDPCIYPDLYEHKEKLNYFSLFKRGIDIVGALLLLGILAPLLLAIGCLVKLSSRGPVIFRQMRIGQMYKPFVIWKFRTMYVDSGDGIHHDYVKWFITSSDKNKISGQTAKRKLFKLTCDPRITPIGKLLRKTSMDELPQLWNVLIGDMSLVGPRPPLLYELQQYKPWHCHRVLDAKPGITGLWQVTGRSQTSFDDMVRLDIRYARSRSIWEDIKILLATPAAVIKGKGAC